jgi:ArsR family transcriptional regulator
MNVYGMSVRHDIDVCQYVVMPKLLDLTPTEAVACCPPLVREPLDATRAGQVAPVFKALADPVRLQLFSRVAAHADGEACVCDLNEAFDLSQPTISHHLKVLVDAGLLAREKRGIWAFFSVRPDALAAVRAFLGDVR